MIDHLIKTISDKPVPVSIQVLTNLEPISRLSLARLQELSEVSVIEKISKDLDPTRMSSEGLQALYLISGDLGIRYENGHKVILRAGTAAARYAVDSERLKIKDTIALTPVEVMRIDLDLLDIMLTWDQLSGFAPEGISLKNNKKVSSVKIDESTFNAFKLKNGVFSKIPAANIEAIFARLTHFEVEAGQVVITQGQEGDYYYLIQHGVAVVSRVTNPNEVPMILAEIGEGSAFGEEALASDTKRNATVTMKTKGLLLRLNKEDFIELLKAPIVNMVNMEEAKRRVVNGAIWLDVRLETEYRYHHLQDAVSAPLNELRNRIEALDRTKQYIAYCQTGRRSSAAAFILAQYGFQAVVLENGTRAS